MTEIIATVSGEWPNGQSSGYPPIVKFSFKSDDSTDTEARFTYENAVLLWKELGKVIGKNYPRQGMVQEAEEMGISFPELCRRIAKHWPNGDGNVP